MKKVINPGLADLGTPRKANVYIEIGFENGKLSLSGVEGPTVSGNARGGCGQIEMSMDDDYINSMTFNDGWDKTTFKRMLNAWRAWHLNDMNAGCEHQRALGWDKILLDDSKPKTQDNMAHWTYPSRSIIEQIIYSAYRKINNKKARKLIKNTFKVDVWRDEGHPKGAMTKPCPECGYKYGSAWLHEDVPQEVIDFLFSLPETQNTPAWV
jgi:hypothetical protein